MVYKALKCACARGSTTLRADTNTGACANSYPWLSVQTQHTAQKKGTQRRAQTCLPWHLWILLIQAALLAGMLPNPCTGARANITPDFGNISHKPCLIRYRDFPSRCHSSVPSLPTLQLSPTALHPPHRSVLAAIERRAQRRS